MPTAEHIEWLNLNANRRYPIYENSTCKDDNNFIELPDYLITDFVITLPTADEKEVYISKLIYSGSTLIFTLNIENEELSEINIDLNSHTINKSYKVEGKGDWKGARGVIVLGNLSNINKDIPQGSYSFSKEATMFEPCTVRPSLEGVTGLSVYSSQSGSFSDLLTGVVELIEGTNIKLTVIPGDPPKIRIDSLLTENFEESCACSAEHDKGEPIRTINGVPPDSHGNITIEATQDCMEITASGNKIKIDDVCSKPCCGCPEQEFLTRELSLLKHDTNMLRQLAGQLQSAQQEFFDKVLASFL